MPTPVDDSRTWRDRAGRYRGFVPEAVAHALSTHRDVLVAELRGTTDPGTVHAVRTAIEELRLVAEQEQVHVRVTGGEIQRALRRLRATDDPGVLLRRAAGELRRSGGFGRAMLSRVDGAHWVPALPPPGLDASADALRDARGEGPVVPMQHRLVEADVVRRQAPLLVRDAGKNPRCDEALVRALRCDEYVVAPIVSGRRVVGLLHADRDGQGVPLAPQDLETIQVFARHVGILHDRAATAGELARRHADLERRQETMARELAALRTGRLLLLPPAASTVWRAELEGVDRDVVLPPASALTAREREILGLLQTGATNAAIAQQLVVSENTVKTHVARASRKLGARSRSECVARWLQIVGPTW